MNDFLNKISQLSSIRNVIFLSVRGEPLFSSNGSKAEIRCWHEIIDELEAPKEADIVFSSGRYYIRKTDIGHVIIGMHDDRDTSKIKRACSQIADKISDVKLRKKILLKMLSSANDVVKPSIIKELVFFADQEVAIALISLLRKEADFSADIRKKLLLFICQTLGYCASKDAVYPLKKLLASHQADGAEALSFEIHEAVGISIEQLERSLTLQPAIAPTAATVESQSATALTNDSISPSREKKESVQVPEDIPEAEKINKLLSSGKKDEAISLAMQLLEESATKKRFVVADALRELIIQIDSMALMQIVRAAEIIEEEKLASINPDHLNVWKNLTEILTTEEFSALYHSMVEKHFSIGEFIARQGANLATLFFINSGRVQIQASKQSVDIPLTTKEAGEVIGAGTFFETSVWTVNVKSLGAELFLLSRKNLNTLLSEHPSLESKLAHFCSTFQSSSAILKKTRKDRRQFERKRLLSRLTFALLDERGNETDIVAKGEIIDISRGGVGFSIHSSRKRNAVSFFGRQLKVSIFAGMSSGQLSRDGTVQAVRDMDLIGNEYSLHIKFREQLSTMELQQVLKSGEKNKG